MMKKNFSLLTFLLTCITITLVLATVQGNANAAPLAAIVDPVLVSGNPSCSDVAPGTTEFKVQPVVDGTFSDGTLTVTIDVRNTADGPVFDFTANIGVDAVIVKGGPNANVYFYNPEVTSDTGLHAPVNPQNNTFFGLSHISFCYDVEPPTNTPTNTATNTPVTPSNTPTDTPTNTPVPPTDTPTDTPTNTPVPPTDTPTNTPTDTKTSTPTKTNTPTKTPTPQADMGHLKVCKIAGAGVQPGTIFTINVNGTPYNVPAGDDHALCVLAGQFPLNTNVTVQEVIPAGVVVASIEVLPGSRQVSKNISIGQVVVKIGTGVTEVVYKNKASGLPTKTPTGVVTPRPTRTPGPATATPAPTGRVQICKEADGAGVTGEFTFTFAGKTRTIPVGTCTSLIVVPVGPLTITEAAKAGYVVSDIYTIPADRLISENLAARSATVTIVQGNASTQTIVIFQNRAQTTQTTTDMAMNTYIHTHVGM
jgi:hypothetical protein